MLSHISLTHFRNIVSAELTPANGINLVVGENGSGKTSLLEAIFLLAMGRSFRSRSLKHLVKKEQNSLTVFARCIEQTPIGVQYDLDKGLTIRLNNAPLKRLSDLAAHLPLQFIPANCHQFFELGPKYRRRMVDWGVFHVEHSFNYHWQSYKKILQQRNSAIRQNQKNGDIQLWDEHLVQHGNNITEHRKAYLNQLKKYFVPLFAQLCPEMKGKEIALRYRQGWNKDEEFLSYLTAQIQRDRILGYTRSGPHAADWSLKIDGADPYEILSRGQQKLFFLALSMSQIRLLAEHKNLSNSLLLIDDLSSELDWGHQNTVMEALRTLPVQAFISTTNDALQSLLSAKNDKTFHVKHGAISESEMQLSTQTQT